MRIYITGSAGSGKSTYANKLSKEFNVPVYRTDDLYNSKEKRMFTIQEIKGTINTDSDWIIEGAYYIPEYVRVADKVIYTKVGTLKTVYRILKRWFVDRDVRNKFSFLSTIKLCFTTVRDMFTSEEIDLKTNQAGHYREKERYNLCRENAKKFVVVKG
jgi:adenylate kinase family enzyme